MSAAEFSLRALAREVWAELDGADYHALAKEIARRVKPAQREAALLEALTEYARTFVTNQRPSAQFRPPAGTDGRTAPPPRTGAGQANSARSSKVAGIRRAWPELRAAYATVNGRKALGECARTDLLFIADNLNLKAQQNTTKATWMRDLAAVVQSHKVHRVCDLPDDVLAGFLRGEAA